MTVATARARGVAVLVALGTVAVACGLTATSAGAVIGGDPVARTAWPAVVRLAEACTATLIAPDRLLSAGHCASRVLPGRTRVRIGAELYTAQRIARHRGFQYLAGAYPAEPYRDLSLVELDRPVPDVAPIAVSRRTAGATPGRRFTLVGYGTGRADEPSDFGVLREARLVVRDDRTCRSALDRADVGQGAQYRPSVMLCTQDPDGVRPFASGCYGDSGAPLLGRGPSGLPLIVGVDSWGVACGVRDGDPEVFARPSFDPTFLRAADPGWTTDPVLEPFAPGRF